MQEYKEISCIFKKENFKMQIVLSCLFRSAVLLYIGLIQIIIITNWIIDLLFLLGLLGICISYLVAGYLEKKGIFIDRKYFQNNRYRSIYMIGLILIWLICKGIFEQDHLTLYILLLVPIEIFASYKEYRLFLKKMDYFNSHDMDLDDSNFF